MWSSQIKLFRVPYKDFAMITVLKYFVGFLAYISLVLFCSEVGLCIMSSHAQGLLLTKMQGSFPGGS